MELKPYPKYKETGVEWIGEIPEHWNKCSLRWEIFISSGDGISNEDILEDGNIPVIGGNGIMGYTYKQNVYNRSIAIGRVGALCGNVHDVKPPAWITDNALWIRKVRRYEYVYLLYFLKAMDLNQYANKSAQPLITGEIVKALLGLIPSIPEQCNIASFLDKKTTQIDEIISKNKHLIELLKEKRTALINHVVTKGLDPNVKMKDSGIEWIGNIPKGWKVHKLKYCSQININKLSDDTNPSFNMNYLDISSVDSQGKILHIDEQYFEEAPSRARRIPKNNDIILSTVRTYLKAVAFLNNIPSNLIVSTGFAVITPMKSMYPKYAFYTIRSECFIQMVIASSKGVAYPAINPPELGQIHIILPPENIQIKLAEYLNENIEKIDETIQKTETKIKLLEEYKKSFIHHVVTGKVDVRGIEA